MNNWLGFSLSPQEIPSQQQPHHHHLSFNSHEINGTDGTTTDECFDSSTLLPSLNLTPHAPPFGVLEEPFNINNNNDTHSQDEWSRKEDGSMNSSSRLIMGMSNSCSNHGPKLENFLGGAASLANYDHHHHHNNNSNEGGGDYMYGSVVEATTTTTASGGGAGFGSSNTIGLSMIKNWLRNNPAPPLQPEDRSGGGVGICNGGMEGTAYNNNNNTQTLSLSMSTTGGGSQSSCSPPFQAASGGGGGETCSSSDNKRQMMEATRSIECQTAGGGGATEEAVVAPPRKSIDTFGQRTSIYRGVTRHRWTGRYEAHLWDNSCRREGQTRKGRQVYLGGYDKEEKAARAYDLAALKYWGTTTTTNFPISNYEKEIEEMKPMTRQEYVASLRRKSSGFSRGASIYRGVTRHHQHGRWQARIGRVAGNKDLYLGTFSTQEEAAEAYDIAAIKFRGLNAVTNFEISRYDVKSILESSTLPIGGAAKRLKDAEQAAAVADIATLDCTTATHRFTQDNNTAGSQLTDHSINNYYHNWMPTVAYQPTTPNFSIHYPYGQPRMWCKQEQQDLSIAADDDGDDTTHQSFQDHIHHHHQLQLGNNTSTHNFFQPSSSNVLHNLMNLDSSTLDHNAANYSQGGAYTLPVATIVGQPMKFRGYNGENEVLKHHHQLQQQQFGGYENAYGGATTTTDINYNGRNLYYENWVPTAVPTLAHEAATFTMWNDT